MHSYTQKDIRTVTIDRAAQTPLAWSLGVEELLSSFCGAPEACAAAEDGQDVAFDRSANVWLVPKCSI